jgi:4-aminobutyrate--pyruvate transaminase
MIELPFYHSFAGKVPAVSTLLAEALIRIAPEGMSRALFANSGSEANDTAGQACRGTVNNALGRPQKKKIVSRQRAYHGMTVACGKPHRPRVRADGLRLADRALPAHRLPALLPRRAARGEPRRRMPPGSPGTSSS